MLPAVSDPESLTPVTSSGSTGESDADAETETDETVSALDVLSDRRRRAILQYLADRDDDGPVSVTDLADHVALAEENQQTGPLASCGDALFGTRRRVRISLRHHHLPKLAAVDAVAFDHESNTITLRDDGGELLARANAIDRGADACKPNAQ